MTRRFFSIALAFIVLALPSPGETQVSLSLSPTRGEHAVHAGDRMTESVELVNVGATPAQVTVSDSDWSLDELGTPLFMKSGNRTASASSWIKYTPKAFILKADASKQIRYTLEVPPGTPEGGYRTALVIQAAPSELSGKRPSKGKKRRQLEVHGRFVYFVYITVGSPPPKARLASFEVTSRKSVISARFTVQNTGAVHFRIKGSVLVRNADGRTVADIPISSQPVLQEMKRAVSLEWKDSLLSAGRYTASLKLDIGREELLGEERAFEIRDGP